MQFKSLKLCWFCVVEDFTCPTGGDAALFRLVLELSLGQAEGELEAGLKQHRWTNREASGEVGNTGTPGQWRARRIKLI